RPEASLREERRSESARLFLPRTRPGRVVFTDELEADEISPRSDRDVLLLRLAGTKPAHVPAPDLRLRPVQAARLLESELAFEIDLGIVVHREAAREPRVLPQVAALSEELFGERARLRAVHAELDRGLREGAPEEGGRDRRAGDDHDQA